MHPGPDDMLSAAMRSALGENTVLSEGGAGLASAEQQQNEQPEPDSLPVFSRFRLPL